MNVYLDYAATSPLKQEILEKMLPYFKEDFANPDSLHSFGRRAAHAVTEARDRVAAVLGVAAKEVYFTAGGTEADNWAVRALGGGKALVFRAEHAAVAEAAPFRAGGAEFFPALRNGLADIAALKAQIGADTGLVCLMAVNNETGCIQPLKAVYEAINGRALLFSDCVQAARTQNLKEICAVADAIALSAHKAGGPKGVGALVVKHGELSPLVKGGEQEHGKRGGTLNVAGIVGFSYALERAQAERENFLSHTRKMQVLFEDKLSSALGGEVEIDGENRAPNVTHATFARGGEAFLSLLDLHGVAASGGAACSAHARLPSRVLTAMGRSDEEAKRGVRFSFGEETTEEEILFAADTVIACYQNLP